MTHLQVIGTERHPDTPHTRRIEPQLAVSQTDTGVIGTDTAVNGTGAEVIGTDIQTPGSHPRVNGTHLRVFAAHLAGYGAIAVIWREALRRFPILGIDEPATTGDSAARQCPLRK